MYRIVIARRFQLRLNIYHACFFVLGVQKKEKEKKKKKVTLAATFIKNDKTLNREKERDCK